QDGRIADCSFGRTRLADCSLAAQPLGRDWSVWRLDGRGPRVRRANVHRKGNGKKRSQSNLLEHGVSLWCRCRARRRTAFSEVFETTGSNSGTMGGRRKIKGLRRVTPYFRGPVSYPFTQAELRFKVRTFE